MPEVENFWGTEAGLGVELPQEECSGVDEAVDEAVDAASTQGGHTR